MKKPVAYEVSRTFFIQAPLLGELPEDAGEQSEKVRKRDGRAKTQTTHHRANAKGIPGCRGSGPGRAAGLPDLAHTSAVRRLWRRRLQYLRHVNVLVGKL